MQSYIPMAMGALMAHGAEVLVVDESSQVLEGSTDFPRTVVIKFESREKAEAFYNGAEYKEALAIRLAATDGFAVLVDEFVMPG
jgi:uncharacterized protein (DUF1330 family)